MEKREDKLLAKIHKLLALSKSGNPYEAAKALEMAQKLMEKHNIHQDDVEMSEHQSEVLFAKRTPVYVHNLASIIQKCFGVECYFNEGIKTKAVFLGENERPKIASYCFDVLYRQLAKARKEFTATQSKRLKRSTLIARADAFCEGWTAGVYQNVKDFAMPPEEKEKLERHYNRIKQQKNLMQGNTREVGNTREGEGNNARYKGFQAGKKVTLNHGVNGKESLKLGHGN